MFKEFANTVFISLFFLLLFIKEFLEPKLVVFVKIISADILRLQVLLLSTFVGDIVKKDYEALKFSRVSQNNINE